MKRMTAFFLALVLTLGLLPAANAYQYYYENGFGYEIVDGKAIVVSAPSESDIVIPDTLGGVPVCALSDGLFHSKSVETVHLPATVEELPGYCFNSANLLREINLEHIKRIGWECFYDTTSLTTLTITSACEEISEYAFAGSGLTAVELPEGVRSIGPSAFSNIQTCTAITLPSTLTELGENAFWHTKTASLTIPSGVTEIPANAFTGSVNGTLTLPDTVTALGAEAFSECTITNALTLPDTVTLGRGVFSDCTFTDDLTLPGSIEAIPAECFRGTTLHKLTLGEGLRTVGAAAFQNASLPALTLPGSLKSLGKEAFSGCVLPGDLTVPGSVRTIPSRCFQGAKMQHVTLGAGTRMILSAAFRNAALTALTLPETLEAVSYAGLALASLEEALVIPADVREFTGALANSGLSSVYGSNLVVEIAARADGLRYFDAASGMEATQTPKTVTVNGLVYQVYADAAVLTNGQTASGDLTLPAKVDGKPLELIGARAFTNNEALTGLTIPDSVRYIEPGALMECSRLQYLHFGSGIRRIPDNCCVNCSRLSDLRLPAGLESIGSTAFYDCKRLDYVELPATVWQIGEAAFMNCVGLFLMLPEEIEQIGAGAFENCRALPLLYLGEKFEYGYTLYDSSFSDTRQISDTACLVYEHGTGAERYVELLRAEGDAVYAWAVPEDGAYVFSDNGVYRLEEDHATLAFCPLTGQGAGSSAALYSSVYGLSVTTVASDSFAQSPSSHGGQYSVSISPTVTVIEANAFSGLAGAQTDLYVRIPNVETQIDPLAFENVDSVTLLGFAGSTAEAFARAHGFDFVPIDLPFTDVKDNAWYYSAVFFVYQYGLMNGMNETTFAPDVKLTRAQLAQILYNMNGRPAENWANNWEFGFTDVPADAWYARAVNWCRYAELFMGVSPTQFAPNRPLTREQLVTVFYRYAAKLGKVPFEPNYSLSGFTDAGKISAYALPAMRWAVENGIVTGMTPTTLAPQGTATRAQIATILMRFVAYLQ